MAIINVGGYDVLIDDEDVELIQPYTWHTESTSSGIMYASGRRKGNRKIVKMHRLIFGTAAEIDHKNGNGLDNRKENLRYCTHAQNMANQKKQLATHSRFKGVTWHIGIDRWYAQIRIDGKRIYLGTYTDEEDAARAYDVAALEAWGEYARINFPKEVSDARVDDQE